MQFLLPNEGWQQVGMGSAVLIASDAAGAIVTADRNNLVSRLDSEGTTRLYAGKSALSALTIAPDGALIVSIRKGLVRVGAGSKETVLLPGVRASSLTSDSRGTVYFADKQGGLWRLAPSGQKRKIGGGPSGPLLVLSPDRSLLITGGGGPRRIAPLPAYPVRRRNNGCRAVF